jgi:hypothetical protein
LKGCVSEPTPETYVDAHARTKTFTDWLIKIAWKGLDTLIVTAGVSALQPLMAVALRPGGNQTGPEDLSVQQASVAGIQHTVNVAAAATAGNYVGPLVAAVAFVRPFPLCHSSILTLHRLDSPPLPNLSNTLDPPPILPRFPDPCTYPHLIRLHQNRLSPLVPIALYRAP